jgi:hypothetical protein
LGNSFYGILSRIGSDILLCQVKEYKVSSKNPQYRVKTTNLNGNINLKQYLSDYPLFSTKYLDFKD